MHRVWAPLVVCLLLAGCVTEDAPSPPADRATGEEPPAPDELPDGDPVAPPSGPVGPEAIPVHFNGSLGTFAFACLTQCVGHAVAPDQADLLLDQPGTVLRGMALTMTWSAASPLTEELRLAAMVMVDCTDCEATTTPLDGVTGRSPLTLDLSGLDVAVTEDHVIHVYAFNPRLLVAQQTVFVVASVDQAVNIQGTVTVEPTA